MTVYAPHSLPWREPLALAAAIDEPYWALLHSSVKTSYSGRYSYLAHRLGERVESAGFAEFAQKLTADKQPFDNAWFGVLGYGLKDELETLPKDTPGGYTISNLVMMRFNAVYRFDHDKKTLTLWSRGPYEPPAEKPSAAASIKIARMNSPMSTREYLEKAAEVIARIRAGELYQANLTRKYTGRFEAAPNTFSLFKTLCAASPAPYSAYLKLDDVSLLSSSPELFLAVDARGNVRTRPIKGTAPRFDERERDAASREALATSAKDRAENLMIVDLMRNDLSRSCTGIEVPELFDVTSHTAIHHMASTVTGKKRPECATLDIVKGCFPPGSMTGAPKVAAMRLCSALENVARGAYGGAIGWFSGDGACELSVVIRTLAVSGDYFEFQVGGGIVADSTPENELRELIDKSRGLLAALNIPVSDLEK